MTREDFEAAHAEPAPFRLRDDRDEIALWSRVYAAAMTRAQAHALTSAGEADEAVRLFRARRRAVFGPSGPGSH